MKKNAVDHNAIDKGLKVIYDALNFLPKNFYDSKHA